MTSFGARWGESSAFHGYVAVARDGRFVFAKACGKAGDQGGRGADGDTLFRIGSITKSFTAIGILQLEERGAVRLDDSIRKYIPELPAFAEAVMLRHCLTHTSGLPPIPDDDALVVENGKPHALKRLLSTYADAKLVFPPGERFEYSNAGYTILAAILERVSGQSYESYFREHVFEPAGMTRTTTVSSPMPPDVATGYTIDDRDLVTSAPPIPYVTFGAGAVLSTANDLLAWDRALDGSRLLGDAAKKKMWTPDRDMGVLTSAPTRYALGWMVSRKGDHEVFSHLGGVSGFEASFARVTAPRVTVVVLSNLGGSQLVVRRVAEAALDLALDGTGPAAVNERAPERFDRTLLATLTGDYGMDAPSAAQMRGVLSASGLASQRAFTLDANGERLFLTFVGRPRAEVFCGGDGVLFTKHSGLELEFQGATGQAARAAVVSSVPNAGALRARYVRLGTDLDSVRSDDRCKAGMVRLPIEVGELSPIPPFCLDLTEVTVGAYAACVRAGRCPPAPTSAAWEGISDAERTRWSSSCNGMRRDRQEHPINCVDWAMADAYCRAQGKRLPTAAEWEWAAGGGEQARRYPWGFRQPGGEVCWSGVEERAATCPAGSFLDSDARGGIHDLAGNVWEWTSTAAGRGRIQKGGAWNAHGAPDLEVQRSLEGDLTFRGPNVGFRCAK